MRIQLPYNQMFTHPYSFQAQEHDDELKGDGNSVNYKYRMHDPRLGRFFAIDPLASKYPANSSYAFSENRLIDKIELEGLETSPLKMHNDAGTLTTNYFRSIGWKAVAEFNESMVGIGGAIIETVDAHTITGMHENAMADLQSTVHIMAKYNTVNPFKVMGLKAIESNIDLIENGGTREWSNWATHKGIEAASIAFGTMELSEFICSAKSFPTIMQEAADKAISTMGSGKGHAYGTKVHTEFAKILQNVKNVSTEVSYKNGKVVNSGTRGSIRLDAVVGDVNNPSMVFDLKTGDAKLTAKRIRQIRKELPRSAQNINIEQIKPTKK